MYTRYSQVNESAQSFSQVNRNRVKNLIILLLAGCIAALLIIGIPAIRKNQDTRAFYIQRMQAECDEAVRQTTTLSRNAGADSAAILAKIRSNLYAIRVINSLNSGLGEKRLIEDEQVQSLQNTVDRYLSFLTTGMNTGEYQTTLQNALADLQELISKLE